ncbi:MAG: hypothetical protein JXA33_11300, partial [Anaerolineae bacterium]|nr:hypothetical protein [Anaerolineae bacterium]
IWRVQRPVCVILGEVEAGTYHPIVICNDSRTSVEVHYHIVDADHGNTLAEGTHLVPANQNWQAGALRSYASDHRLYLIEWQILPGCGQSLTESTTRYTFGNHYLAGTPPFSLCQYRIWLSRIAAQPRAFNLEAVVQS